MTRSLQYPLTQHRSCPALLAMAATLCCVMPASGRSPCPEDMKQCALETRTPDARPACDSDVVRNCTCSDLTWRAHATEVDRNRSDNWTPARFEIEGLAQWRNTSTSAGISTSDISLSAGNLLGTGTLGPGPLVRFIYTPDFRILGSTSKVWAEYGQTDYSQRRVLARSFAFAGITFGSTVNIAANTKQFQLGYAPRWGTSRFRIGPSFTYERLDVNVALTDWGLGAPSPTKRQISLPNSIFLLGSDLDYMPVRRVDVYGRFGALPCCGGGWHQLESEFGTKYYFTRHLSLMGGVRYGYLKRDFDLPATVVDGATLGPISGFLKFSAISPFVGASWRF